MINKNPSDEGHEALSRYLRRQCIVDALGLDPDLIVVVVAGSFIQAMNWREEHDGTQFIPESRLVVATSPDNLAGRQGPIWIELVGTWETRKDLAEIWRELNIIRLAS